MNQQLILKSAFFVFLSIGLFAFQEEEATPSSSEAAIEAKLEERIKDFKSKQYWTCQREALQAAVPKADSMIAEMYARDLRANDILLERPERPERPEVEIEPFPFDSIK